MELKGGCWLCMELQSAKDNRVKRATEAHVRVDLPLNIDMRHRKSTGDELQLV